MKVTVTKEFEVEIGPNANLSGAVLKGYASGVKQSLEQILKALGLEIVPT